MKLTVLLDNNTFIDQYFIGEPGVSYFIEDGEKKILFDVGYSDAFLINAKKLGIDLHCLDYVILSHGHLDHTWGLRYLTAFLSSHSGREEEKSKPVLLTHPLTFNRRVYRHGKEIGPNMAVDEITKIFNLQSSDKAVQITRNLTFLGEIPRTNDFENQKPLGKIITSKDESPDFLKDDSALAWKSNDGLVIITGCSHSGICNIVDYAKKVLKTTHVIDIVGGLHLLNPSTLQLEGTFNYFKELKPDAAHACHCTDLQSKIALAKVSNLKEVGVGLTLEY